MQTRTAAKISVPLPTFARPTRQDAGMASESYTVAETASLLGVSERRVRQMAADGRLPVVGEHPTRLAAQAVIEERKRRAITQAGQTTVAALNDPDQIRTLVTALVSELLPRALEGRDRVEEMLQAELAEARSRATQAEETAAQLRAEIEEMRSGKPWKRKKKKRKK